MTSVAQSETIGCSNPRLKLYTAIDGVAVDVEVLEYAIFEEDGTTVVKARSAIDPETDCPTGQRIGLGVYTLDDWTVDPAQAEGRYKIQWWYQQTATSEELTQTQEFEVLTTRNIYGDGYALVQDFRDEGWTVAAASDARLLKLISKMSRRIDRLTGQWFEPRTSTFTVDGRQSLALRFPVPIIAISEVRIDGTVLDASAYRTYNRHLRGIYSPDDRGDPRIVLYDAVFSDLPVQLLTTTQFPDGKQNIQVDGVFGYTDPPGPIGITPEDLREACMRMVAKGLPSMSDTDAADDAVRGLFVERIRTRDQEIAWDVGAMKSSLLAGYSLTGDPTIDQLLIPLMAPISIGDTGGATMIERGTDW